MDMKTALAAKAAGEVLSTKQVHEMFSRSPADGDRGTSQAPRSERTVSLG